MGRYIENYKLLKHRMQSISKGLQVPRVCVDSTWRPDKGCFPVPDKDAEREEGEQDPHAGQHDWDQGEGRAPGYVVHLRQDMQIQGKQAK